ncbi:rRNA methyltransferase [Clostridia bacterium]|nr:rRNA methyltransferase [Clostridia bacterium]
MMKITSRQNPLIRQYRALFREKSARVEAGVAAVESVKLYNEAIKCGLSPANVLVTEKMSASGNADFSQKDGITVITEEIAAYISDTKSPQGVFFQIKLLGNTDFPEEKLAKPGKYLFLDNMQEPGNVGAIIRAADAFGLSGVFLSESADVNSPKTLRGAMGSAFRMPLYEVPGAKTLTRLTQSGFAVYAAMLDDSAEKLPDVSFPEKTCVVIGNESRGVSAEIAGRCSGKVFIPIENAQSLGASAAAAIFAYALASSRFSR